MWDGLVKHRQENFGGIGVIRQSFAIIILIQLATTAKFLGPNDSG